MVPGMQSAATRQATQLPDASHFWPPQSASDMHSTHKPPAQMLLPPRVQSAFVAHPRSQVWVAGLHVRPL
jgi:hypothetical protein